MPPSISSSQSTPPLLAAGGPSLIQSHLARALVILVLSFFLLELQTLFG